MDITKHMSASELHKMFKGEDCDKINTNSQSIERLSLLGLKSRERGYDFEKRLGDGCRFYANLGKAIINKVPEPYTVLPNGKKGNCFIGRHTARAEPDFKGVVKGGRAIVFEAKSTGKSRIQYNALTPTQHEWMRCQMEMGALTFVAVNIRDKYFMIPYFVWADMKIDYGKMFLMSADIPEYEVKFDLAGIRFLEYKNGKCII